MGDINSRGVKASVYARRLIFFGFFCLSLFSSGGLGIPGIVQGASDLAYEVAIQGSVNPDLKKLLEAVSQSVELRSKPPITPGLLKRRINQDIPRFQKALRSQGFYDAHVTSTIDEKERPIKVIFHVEPGPPYLLDAVEIHITDRSGAHAVKLPKTEEIGLDPGKPALSKAILNAEQEITRRLRDRGFPFARMGSRKVIVDHDGRHVSVTFQVQAGPLARFGMTTIEGLTSVDEAYVMEKIPWREGDRFDGGQLNALKKRLNGMDLFSTVEVSTGENVDPEGRLPVRVKVRERKPRTVKTGIGFKTDEGPAGKISWEHRNFFGRAERMELSGEASGIGFALENKFRKPEFRRPDQSLLLDLRLAEDRPDAFTSTNLTAQGQIERRLAEGMDLGAGLGYRTSKVEQLGGEDRFQLIFLPVTYQWNTSDDPLDPSSGGRLNLNAAPYFDFYGTDVGFFKGFVRYSRYLQVSKKPSVVMAGRGSLGTISGAERDEIPADLRFYAGGGGSIRGYAYQSVGPLQGTEPVGGRSLIGVSLECRLKWNDRIGFVGFLDGGNAFEAGFPDFRESLRWGTGLGFRYYTPVGPLRLDLGFPLNRREGIDDAFQVYVSIGQAF